MKLKDVLDGRTYQVFTRCQLCREELNVTHPVLGAELRRHWHEIAMAAPLCAKRCSQECFNLEAGANVHTLLEIVELAPPAARTPDKVGYRRSDPRHRLHLIYCQLTPRCDQVELMVDRLIRHGVKI